MTTAVGLFRGVVAATALVIDVDLIGPDEARRRVVSLWPDGARLVSVDGGWLLLLPQPQEFRIDRAPGVPLRALAGGLVGPGVTDAVAGVATWHRGGRRYEVRLDQTIPVPMQDWFDLDAIPQYRLTALDTARAPAEKPTEQVTVEPDLRALAGIGPAESSPPVPVRTPRPPLLRSLLGLAAVAAVCTMLLIFVPKLFGHHPHHGTAATPTGTSMPSPSPTPLGTFATALPDYQGGSPAPYLFDNPEPSSDSSHVTFWPAVPALILAVRLLIAGLRRRPRGPAYAAGTPKPKRGRNWLARLILGSPAKGLIGRRHRRYLHKITRQLESGDYAEGLRNAITLGGSGTGGMLDLRIPKARNSLALTSGSGGGGYIDYGETVREHLRQLYLRSADRLEEAGDLMSAAFVKAVLLSDPVAAIALLEKHNRYRTAAELAQARRLDPALVVRLWWLAGDRGRAIDVARGCGAFAVAIERFQPVDPAGAVALRAAWVWLLQQAGDRLGAVEAAWPEPTLRPLVRAELAAATSTPGPVGARLLAFALAARWDCDDTEAAQRILDHGEPSIAAALMEGLAGRPTADPGNDRRLAGSALRAAIRDRRIPDQLGERSRHRAVQELRGRADPLLVADLVPIRGSEATGPVPLTLPDAPGQLSLQSAVTLADGRILAAFGAQGVRLLSADGRTVARWDVPADQLVVADHGESALLVSRSEHEQEISRLDLVTQRVRPWTTLRVRMIMDSFDGSAVTVLDETGIALIDVLSERPRVIRRELDETMRVLALTRTGTDLTALLSIPTAGRTGERHLGLWRWDVPSMHLRIRRQIEIPDGSELMHAVVCSGTVILHLDAPQGGRLVRYHEYSAAQYLDFAVNSDLFLASRGRASIIGHQTDTGDCHARLFVTGQPIADYVGPGAVRMTEHQGIVTLFSPDGRIVAVSSRPAQLRARLRTQL